MTDTPLTLVWFRRDLRLYDHAALSSALSHTGNIQPVFVFDTDILARFRNPNDRRLIFIAETLFRMEQELSGKQGGFLFLHGKANELIPKLAQALGASRVVAAEDYEPATRARDKSVAEALRAQGVAFSLVKDHVVVAPTELVKGDGEPYKVYTPYSRAWLAHVTPMSFHEFGGDMNGRLAHTFTQLEKAKAAGIKLVEFHGGVEGLLESIGYQRADLGPWPVEDAHRRLNDFIERRMQRYGDTRDMMADEHGTSRISPYLRFGVVSVREAFRLASSHTHALKWMSELIWREFFATILYHYPNSANEEWSPAYRGIQWSRDMDLFDAWRQGMTGYPVVDAAMRELLAVGWMHNRARMIVASFLTKDLQIDWRLGESHFAQHLMDYDLASNVGGWQWAASTGTDAQPYFRVFNPTLQSKKFDPHGAYIRRYVPELARVDDALIHEPWKGAKPQEYPYPIVDHDIARKKILALFKHVRADEGGSSERE